MTKRRSITSNLVRALLKLVVLCFIALLLLADGVLSPTLSYADDEEDDGHGYEECHDKSEWKAYKKKCKYPIEISKVSDLYFNPVEAESDMRTIVILPNDSGAAVFDAKGEPNEMVRVSVLHPAFMDLLDNYSHSHQGEKKIHVNDFTYGGSLNERLQGGTGVFDIRGALNNMRIGATAKLPPHLVPGDYLGYLTLRVVYQ
ncbi:DUF4402 domain-containing protein [Deltaproteobacteria bacterium TL4]